MYFIKIEILRTNDEYQFSRYKKNEVYKIPAAFQYGEYYVGILDDGKHHHSCVIKKTDCKIIHCDNCEYEENYLRDDRRDDICGTCGRKIRSVDE